MSLRPWLVIVALVATTAALCATSIGLLQGPSREAVIWPANAVVLAFLLGGLPGLRQQAVGLAAAVTTMMAVNFALGIPTPLALGFPIVNGLEITVAAWCLRHVRMPMSEAADYLGFALGAVFAAPLMSSLAAAGLVAGAGFAPEQGVLDYAVGWFACEALGMAIVAPFALTIAARGLKFDFDRRLLRGALVQLLVLSIPLAACLQITTHFPFSVFIFPAVATAVFVSRDIGGLLAVTIVATVLIGGAALGYGPAARAEQIGADGMLMVQALLASLVATVHPLSAVLRRLDAYAAEAEERRRRAEQLSASKTRFLSEVSEEIRTPLTGVLTVAELLQSGRMGALTDHQRRLLDRMRESGAEIETLSRKLQDAAAIQSGRPTIAADRINLSALLVSSITAARFKSRERPCEFRLGAADMDLEVIADQARLRASIIGLLVAAARFAARPGLVQVSAVDDRRGRVRILIEDNGDGVPAQRLRELYTASPETSGVGIGLGMTRDFIRMQGGDLGIEEGALGGARVWLELPSGRVANAA